MNTSTCTWRKRKSEELVNGRIVNIKIAGGVGFADVRTEEEAIAGLEDLDASMVMNEIEGIARRHKCVFIIRKREELETRTNKAWSDAYEDARDRRMIVIRVGFREVRIGDEREPLFRNALETKERLDGYAGKDVGEQVFIIADYFSRRASAAIGEIGIGRLLTNHLLLFCRHFYFFLFISFSFFFPVTLTHIDIFNYDF